MRILTVYRYGIRWQPTGLEWEGKAIRKLHPKSQSQNVELPPIHAEPKWKQLCRHILFKMSRKAIDYVWLSEVPIDGCIGAIRNNWSILFDLRWKQTVIDFDRHTVELMSLAYAWQWKQFKCVDSADADLIHCVIKRFSHSHCECDWAPWWAKAMTSERQLFTNDYEGYFPMKASRPMSAMDTNQFVFRSESACWRNSEGFRGISLNWTPPLESFRADGLFRIQYRHWFSRWGRSYSLTCWTLTWHFSRSLDGGGVRLIRVTMWKFPRWNAQGDDPKRTDGCWRDPNAKSNHSLTRWE